MPETVYNKLVRDKIPSIIAGNNETAITRILTDDEYKFALLEKLVEEARELLNSPGDIKERADIGEVLSALDEVFGWSQADIQSARDSKNAARGGFTGRVYLEKTIDG